MNRENSLGKKIKEARLLKGLTQEELAEKADIDNKHLSKIENGLHLPSYKTIVKLSSVLDFDISDNSTIQIPDSKSNATYAKAIKILNTAKNTKEINLYYQALKLIQKTLNL